MAELKCPNCQAGPVMAGADGRMICPKCGGSFVWKEGDIKLVGAGEYDELKGQVKQLTEDIRGLRDIIAQPGKPESLPDPAGDDEDDDL